VIRGARSSCLRLLGAAAAVVAIEGCVLADPAPTLPLVSELPLSIDTTSAYPPVANPAVFATWPDHFMISVYETDPSQPLQWIAYEDYSPLSFVPSNQPVYRNPQLFPADLDGGLVRTVVFPLQQPTGPGCHNVEIVVANSFSPGYTPDGVGGGASVSWTFTNGGNLTDCATYDAGYLVDASFPDAATPDATIVDGGS
jgi:hypothetical protein